MNSLPIPARSGLTSAKNLLATAIISGIIKIIVVFLSPLPLPANSAN
jgi:hypothetical protein